MHPIHSTNALEINGCIRLMKIYILQYASVVIVLYSLQTRFIHDLWLLTEVKLSEQAVCLAVTLVLQLWIQIVL